MKLSIGIPVFNGATTIAETLASVIPQVKEGVEIVVSDNDSTDETAAVVAELANCHPFIRYYRNDRNVGFDANVLLTVERSLGEYVWLLGDDDEISAGGVESVLKAVFQHQKLGAVFVNYGLYDRATGICNKERVARLKSDVVCEDESQFLSVVGILPNFLSSVVVNRDSWLKQDPTPFQGSNWMHFGLLLSLMPSRRAYCVATPFVLNKGVNVGGPNFANRDGVALKIMLDLIDIVSNVRNCGYKKEAVNAAIDAAYKAIPGKISSSRRNGLRISLSLVGRMVRLFGRKPIFWFRDLPLLFFPQVMHFWAWRLYRTKIAQKFYWQHFSRY